MELVNYDNFLYVRLDTITEFLMRQSRRLFVYFRLYIIIQLNKLLKV